MVGISFIIAGITIYQKHVYLNKITNYSVHTVHSHSAYIRVVLYYYYYLPKKTLKNEFSSELNINVGLQIIN